MILQLIVCICLRNPDRDGAAGCGVFCAVYNALQQLQQDEEVDLVTIVRQLQIRRPEMIATLVSTRVPSNLIMMSMQVGL